ncbi:MAG: helix-turn-helix domain-containing protein [Fibromonadales bacterium]|nr:helix-turn-helix domain-containing protein [Fibromonadales bacterium]
MAKIEYSENLVKAFSDLLCEERKKRTLSQLELAKKSGLTRQCISLFETCQRIPTFFSLLNLAKGFDIPVAKLVSLFMKKLEFYEQQEKRLLAAKNKKSNKWF